MVAVWLGFKRWSGWFGIGWIAAGSAVLGQGITIDGSTATTISTLPGGGIAVGIAAPDGRGVSHNAYTAFSVDEAGVEFGNEGRGATVIVNEVTAGAGASHLNGAMTVAGDRADVVVVNPNGIRINGARVSNVRALSLIAGRRVADGAGGQLRFAIGAGGIDVAGAGLTGDAERIDLAAGQITVGGLVGSQAAVPVVTIGLHAGQGGVEIAPDKLSVNDPGYLVLRDRGAVSAGPTATFVLSQSALLSGGRILITADDRGAGVSMAGRALAATGEFGLTADGRITLTGAEVSGRTVTQVKAGGGIEATGSSVVAELETLHLDAGEGDLTVTNGTVASRGDLGLAAGGGFTLQGGAAGRIESFQGAVSGAFGGDITVAGAQISAGLGMVLSGPGDFVLQTTAADRIAVLTTLGGPLQVDVAGDLANRSGRIVSSGAAELRAGGAIRNGALVEAGSNALSFGQEIGQIRAAGALVLTAGGGVDTTGGTLDGQSVRVDAAGLRADRQVFGTIGQRQRCFLFFCRQTLVGGLSFGGGAITATEDLVLRVGAAGADLNGAVLSGRRIELDGARFAFAPVIYRTAYEGPAGLRGWFSGRRVRFFTGFEAAALVAGPGGLVLTAGSTADMTSVDLTPVTLANGLAGITQRDVLPGIAQANRPRGGIFAPVLD